MPVVTPLFASARKTFSVGTVSLPVTCKSQIKVLPYQNSASTAASVPHSTYRRRIRRRAVGAPHSSIRRSSAPHSAAASSSAAAPCRVVRRVKRSAVSHCTSQKGMPYTPHRFSTRSGAGLSHWNSTLPRR